MTVQPFSNSLFNSMSYLIDNETLIDCGDWHEEYEGVHTVLLTHAHFDHIYGLNELVKQCPEVRIFSNGPGRVMLLDSKKNMSRYHETPFVFLNPDAICIVEDGDKIDLPNGLTAKAIFTPGHNPSCITWQIGNELFTGDAYIPGLKTVTNLPKGNKEEAEKSIRLIRELANNRTIYSGHQIIM